MGLAASGSAVLLYVVLRDLELGRSDPKSSYRSSLCANVQMHEFFSTARQAATFFVRSF